MILFYNAWFYFDRNWKWPDSLFLKTNILDGHYTVEGKISLSTLNKLGLIKDNELEIGIYRGHCTELVGENATIEWSTWVDSKTDEPDFHVPASFGKVKLEN